MKKYRHTYSRFLFVGVFAVLSLAAGFFYTSFVSAQPLNDQKRSQAASTALPTAEFHAEPSYLVKKGGEVNLFSMFRGYAGESNEADHVLYSWCIDGRPIHPLIAGSSDEFIQDGSGYRIENDYGVLSGGQGSCRISQIYNQEHILRWYDGLDGGQDMINRMFDEVFEKNKNDAITEYAQDELLRRLGDLNNGVYNLMVDVLKSNPDIGAFEKELLLSQVLSDVQLGADVRTYFELKSRFSYQALRKDVQDSVMLTRTPDPDDDIDQDGMSDRWEIKYFGKYAGRKNVPVKQPTSPRGDSYGGVLPDFAQGFIPEAARGALGLNATPTMIDVAAINPEPRDANGDIIPNPTNEQIFGDFLRSIKPEHDFDGDGFFFGENYGNCSTDFFYNLPEDHAKRIMFAGEACWARRSAVTGENSFLSVGDFGVPGPEAVIVPGIITELWQTGVPYARMTSGQVFDLDKGYFPNGFEYVAGTHPDRADTDSDGVPDGYDFAGLQQSNLPLRIEKNDDYYIDVHLFGRTQRGSIIRGFEGIKEPPDVPKYNNTPFRNWRTDLEGQRLKVGGGLELPTRLIYSPYPVTPSSVGCGGNLCADKIHVTAATATEDVGESSLFYSWYLDGVLLPADNSELATESLNYMRGLQNQSALGPVRGAQNGQKDIIFPSGYGKNVLSFGLNYGKALWEAVNKGQKDLLPCSVRTVGLDVIDAETTKTSHAEIDIRIGDDVEMNERLIANVDPSKDSLLQGYNFNDQSIKGEVFQDVILPQLKDSSIVSNETLLDRALLNQQFKDLGSTDSSIDPVKGYRRGDIISVSARLSGAPRVDASGNLVDTGKNNCADGYYDELLYKWYFDDLYLEAESGRGKRTIEVAATNIGSDLRHQSDEGSHYLKLEVVDPSTDELFATHLKEIRVVAPYIDFNVSGVEKLASASSESGIADVDLLYKAQPGSNVKIIATPRYFRPFSDGSEGYGFEYQWLRNGSPIEGASGTLTGSVPPSVTLDFTTDSIADAYDEISLEISTSDSITDGSSQALSESATTVAVFMANPPESFDDVEQDQSGLEGFLLGFVSEEYRQTYNTVFIFGGFTLLAIVALLLYQRNQKQSSVKK
jgi:hypothetical protein